MKYTSRSSAILVLQDGKVFYGKAAGAKGTATGEICFNTGMTGYQEIFTDPSYFGQLMVMTNVHVGNYGIHAEEIESDSIKIAGLIVRNFNDFHSRPSAQMSINEYLIRNNVVGICDVDTRAVVRYIRSKGAMNAIISTETSDIEKLKAELAKVPSMEGLELSSRVSTKKPYFFGEPDAKYKVSVLDLGLKKSILRMLAERNCYIQVFPMNSTLEEMAAWNPDGFLISNGPGDPAVMPQVVKNVSDVIAADYPVFGICLGHQIIAEANGLRTYKMHIGHRGGNHPVKNLITGKDQITSQNHGFGVKAEDVKKNKNIVVTHINLNDDTIEGIRMVNKNVFSVQYHPEAGPGPHDSRYLFDDFVSMMERSRASSKKKLSKAAAQN
ncbi:MAG: glutamine-hydrolyzing carbamoyl-phosphate synthase small subunit [Bacteroidota bacterium]